jgi:hypothetical protein
MINETIIEHQFVSSNFFLPTWEIKTLVLGTFNPSCGEKTDYFYGRCQNNFWRTLEEIHDLDYMWFQNNFERKLKFMKLNEFGCADIIKYVLKSDEIDIKEICGSGYSDQILFTTKKCKLTYHFDNIKTFILHNNVKKVIHTWGKRNSPTNFKNQINEFKTYCSQNSVEFIEGCPSPSGRLRGKEHKENLMNFYKVHLTKPAHNNV